MRHPRLALAACLAAMSLVGVASPLVTHAASAQQPRACELEGATQIAECLAGRGDLAAHRVDDAYATGARRAEEACSGVMEAGLANCLERAVAAEDARLQDVLRRVRDLIRTSGSGAGERSARLDRSQAAWQAYVAATCDDVGAAQSQGQDTGAAPFRCRLSLAGARAAEVGARNGLH